MKLNIIGCPGHIATHIRSVISPQYSCTVPLRKDRFLPVAISGVVLDDLECKVCNYILDEAVVPCKHSVCCTCCFDLLKSNVNSFLCPDCKSTHTIATSSFSAVAPVTSKLISQLVVHCDKEHCRMVVYLADLRGHLNSKCKHTSNLRHTITLDQILAQTTSTLQQQGM